jgi:uncharacterized cupin superfamily protein
MLGDQAGAAAGAHLTCAAAVMALVRSGSVAMSVLEAGTETTWQIDETLRKVWVVAR